MAFKKHNWMTYSREGKIIEITIRENDGRKMDFFRCNNDKEFNKIANIIKIKYGFNFKPEINKEDSMNFKEEFEEEERFLNKELQI